MTSFLQKCRAVEFDDTLFGDIGLDNPMQKGIRDAPLLIVTDQRHCLIVETNDLATSLVLIPIDEPNYLTYGDLIAAQTLLWLFSNLDIGAIQIDGGVGNQPTSPVFLIQDDRLFSAHLKNLALPQRIGLRIEILNRAADLYAGLHRQHPTRLIQHSIYRCAHSVEFKRRSSVQGFQDVREVHGDKSFFTSCFMKAAS